VLLVPLHARDAKTRDTALGMVENEPLDCCSCSTNSLLYMCQCHWERAIHSGANATYTQIGHSQRVLSENLRSCQHQHRCLGTAVVSICQSNRINSNQTNPKQSRVCAVVCSSQQAHTRQLLAERVGSPRPRFAPGTAAYCATVPVPGRQQQSWCATMSRQRWHLPSNVPQNA
jgi:hypothetical protein